MIADLDPKTRRRDGYDVAYMAVWVLGLFLTALVVCLTVLHVWLGSDVSDGMAQVLIAGVGAVSTIAGAALGYQVGSRSSARRSTDPDSSRESATATETESAGTEPAAAAAPAGAPGDVIPEAA